MKPLPILLLLLALLAATAAACGSGVPPASVTSVEPPQDGYARLGADVVPTHYALDLRIDPTSERFSGTAAIQVDVREATPTIRLHAADMRFRSARVEAGGGTRSVETELGPNGALRLRAEPPFAAGVATLRFEWDAPLPETPYGLYRVRERGQWYAFTQFEPLEARKAFPCFDQPEFKTPFEVTLRVPSGMVALANAPLADWHVLEDTGEVGWVFTETEPLPTYLVAFAVGDLERLEVPRDESPPIGIVSTAGKIGLAAWAAERTPPILEWLTNYFGRPYPFAKLDLIGVPNFGAGAMENVGLVTFRERLLLLDGEREPITARRASQSVIAHELAHMWYGDLVTMPWWDDLWLNESFATWMATKALIDLAPELESDLDAIAHAQYVMGLDSKRDARQVRQPIRYGGDVYNAFDGITYGKGASVLRMIESWIGEEAFRDGVRSYMAEHAYGSGGTNELLEALGAASGRDVRETVRLFLDQPGTPLIDVGIECSEGTAAGGPPRLALEQTRYLPQGSEAPIGEPWTVPVCVAHDGTGDGSRTRECFLLDAREKVVPLDSAARCPTWLHPNADERGYYRFSLSPDRLVSLVEDHLAALSIGERSALASHASAMLEAGSLPVTDHVRVLAALARDAHRAVVQGVVWALYTLSDVAVGESDAPAYAHYVRELLEPHLRRIGIDARPGEPAEAGILRASLVPTMAELTRDAAIEARARTLAKDFLRDPESVSRESLGQLLPVASAKGDEALWEALVGIVAEPPSPGIREAVVRALGSFEDPALLERSFDLLLDERLRAQDYRTLQAQVRPLQRAVAWRWLTRNYAAIAGRLGPMTSTQLPDMARGFCTLADRGRVEAFFASVEGAPPGTERNTHLVLEDIERCARLRASIQAPLSEWLAAGAEVPLQPSSPPAQRPRLTP